MARTEGSIVIARPVEVVFDFVADMRNEPRYNHEVSSVELLSEGPIGAGSRFRAVTEARGRPLEMNVELTEFERPAKVASVMHSDVIDVAGAMTFWPVSEGTRLQWSWDTRLKGWLRLLGPVIGRHGRRREERIWASLKAYLEGREGDRPADPDVGSTA